MDSAPDDQVIEIYLLSPFGKKCHFTVHSHRSNDPLLHNQRPPKSSGLKQLSCFAHSFVGQVWGKGFQSRSGGVSGAGGVVSKRAPSLTCLVLGPGELVVGPGLGWTSAGAVN